MEWMQKGEHTWEARAGKLLRLRVVSYVVLGSKQVEYAAAVEDPMLQELWGAQGYLRFDDAKAGAEEAAHDLLQTALRELD